MEREMYQERDSSFSNRSILVNAPVSVAQSPEEKQLLDEYKCVARLLRMEQARLERDSTNMSEDIKHIVSRYNFYDHRLIEIENTIPIKNLLIREKDAIYKRRVNEYEKRMFAEREKVRQQDEENRRKAAERLATAPIDLRSRYIRIDEREPSYSLKDRQLIFEQAAKKQELLDAYKNRNAKKDTVETTWTCGKCKQLNVASNQTCWNCGSALLNTKNVLEGDTWICGKCKKRNLLANQTCWNCGNSRSKVENVIEETEWVCGNCKKRNALSKQTCWYCNNPQK